MLFRYDRSPKKYFQSINRASLTVNRKNMVPSACPASSAASDELNKPFVYWTA
jgi:hypothetical protein